MKVIKYFDALVKGADQVTSQTYELDKDIQFVKGILLTSNRDDLLYYRGSQRIEINKREVVPEGYESKNLMCGINVPLNLRYYETDPIPTGNRVVKVEYKDSSDSRTPFEPYRIRVNMICEQTETT